MSNVRGQSGLEESRKSIANVFEADVHLNEMFMEGPAKYDEIIQHLSAVRSDKPREYL